MKTASDNSPANEPPANDRRETITPTRMDVTWWLGKIIPPVSVLVAGILLIVLLGLAQRIGWLSASGNQDPGDAKAAGQIHTCPMHPQIRQPNPGRCPICGMALVVATSSSENLDILSVKIEPAQRRLANIQTAPVRREPVAITIRTVGAIAIDESRMATIPSYISGRLERLFADYTGVDVSKGDHLAVVYSPELFTAQVHYVESRESLAQTAPGALPVVREAQQKFVVNLRQKLVELGMRDDLIQKLERDGKPQSRLTIYAPSGGTVIEKLAVEGKYIKAGDPIYRIADLSTVWLMMELYPEDAARLRYGERVEAEMQSLPGEVFNGRVAFVDRTVSASKRTVGVRVEFLNEDRQLRPGDYANATIFLPVGQQGEAFDADLAGKWISPMHPQIISDRPGTCSICGMDLVPTARYGYATNPVRQPSSLFVPRSAVLMAGNNSVVYVETEPGRFQIRPITLGAILRDKVVVLSGLKEGEQVATAGNFLIDSQMQLAGNPSLIDPTRAIAKLNQRKTPLAFTNIEVQTVPGADGAKLEAVFEAYFKIQQALAADKPPAQTDAVALHRLSSELAAAGELSGEALQLIATIAENSEHLHHLAIEKARLDAFRPLSHAIVKLAAMVRGPTAKGPYYHMFCPMVKGGSGDWLQPNDKLVNPYWGSEMLTCGQVAHQFPMQGAAKPPNSNDTKKNPPRAPTTPPAEDNK